MAYPYQTGYNQYYQPQYPAMQPGYPQPQQQAPVCRMVSSREEASSTPVDFMGTLMIFPDVQNNRIYTKRWNPQAGVTDFGEYIPAPKQQNPAEGAQPAADPVMSMLTGMQQQLDDISKRLTIPTGESVGGADK